MKISFVRDPCIVEYILLVLVKWWIASGIPILVRWVHAALWLYNETSRPAPRICQTWSSWLSAAVFIDFVGLCCMATLEVCTVSKRSNLWSVMAFCRKSEALDVVHHSVYSVFSRSPHGAALHPEISLCCNSFISPCILLSGGGPTFGHHLHERHSFPHHWWCCVLESFVRITAFALRM